VGQRGSYCSVCEDAKVRRKEKLIPDPSRTARPRAPKTSAELQTDCEGKSKCSNASDVVNVK